MAFTNSLIGYATTTIPFGVAGSVSATSTVFGSTGGASPVAGKAAASSAAFASVGGGSIYSPSPVGYVSNTLTVPVSGAYPVWGNPVTAATTVFGALPSATAVPSPIGFAVGSLSNPGSQAPSPIGFAVGTVGGASVTVPPGQTNLEPGGTVVLTGSGGDSGGTTSWSQVSGPTASLSVAGSTVTVTCPGAALGATVVLRYAVNVAFSDVSLTVLPVTERALVGGVEVPLIIYG